MRVGVVPFREKKGRFQICLISSLSKPKRMTFPKGLTKKGEGWEVAALREMHEEAGLMGTIIMRRLPLLLSSRKRPDESCVLFWCRIDNELRSWPEKKLRARIWHTVGDDMDFQLTRNASKIYQELLDLDLDQDMDSPDGENLLRQQLRLTPPGARLIA